ncbi:MAG: hypothetical protein WBN43_17065 [Thiogranum sp.]
MHGTRQLWTFAIFQRILSWLQILKVFIAPIIVFSYFAGMFWKRLRASYQFVLPVALYSMAALILSACASTYGHQSRIPRKTLEIRELIEPGSSTRNEIRQILGEPTMYNDRYHLEMYRDTDTEWDIPIFPPLPVRHSQKYVSYVLITYNDDWVVNDFDTGVWIEHGSAPWAKSAEFVHIGVGDFCLYTANPYSSSHPFETLLAPVDWKQAASTEPMTSKRCIVYLSPDLLIDKIYLDEVMLAEMAGVDLSRAYFRLPMMPGEHRLKFDLRDLVLTYSTQSLEHSFSCAGKQPLYIDVTVDFEPKESPWQRTRYKVNVNQSQSMPVHYNEKRQILYHHGKWWEIHDLNSAIE